jgi:hypothetical protein
MPSKATRKLAKEVLDYIMEPSVTWVNHCPVNVTEECLYTAVFNVAHSRHKGLGFDALVDEIQRKLGVPCLVEWNDWPARIKEEVICVLQDIIKDDDKKSLPS